MRQFHLPDNVATTRFKPPRSIQLPEDTALPLVGGADDPDEKKVQEVWKCRAQVFRLPGDEEAYEAVWQRCVDGEWKLCKVEENFDPNSGGYVALLRWAEIDYKLPTGLSGETGAVDGTSEAN